MANRLSADIAAARAAGMSYGKYKVLHPCVEIEEPKPEPDPEKEAKKIPCAFCGELFVPWHGKKYCSEACREEKNLIDSRNRYWKKKQEAKANTIDVEKAVMCKSCRHYTEGHCCRPLGGGSYEPFPMDPEDFCSRGKER